MEPLEKISSLLVELVDRALDLPHRPLLDRAVQGGPDLLVACLRALDTYAAALTGPYRWLRMERVARVEADIWREMARFPGFSKLGEPFESPLDSAEIRALKLELSLKPGHVPLYHLLAQAYEGLILKLQQRDLQEDLEQFRLVPQNLRMAKEDFPYLFRLEAPLRVALSSANASDNHTRSKEKGGKALNASVDLDPWGKNPRPPLTVTARRLKKPGLRLEARSCGSTACFVAESGESPWVTRERFFVYRRGRQDPLRLLKQALVHVGVVREGSPDPIEDVRHFTQGGGLELTTESRVQQGSGLGTSSILAAALLKVLYRMAGCFLGTREGEYPDLYNQSLLLEQSLGLNSGWQDARGAYGGPSAVKHFYAPPGPGLPAPRVTFLTEVDPGVFEKRVVLFNTGMARAAVRGLNALLDVYLSRDKKRYPAMVESLRLHDRMVAALRAGEYGELGRLMGRYWELRCAIDPQATHADIQYLFTSSEITSLIHGGLITGAGGGGFALFVAQRGKERELKERLHALRRRKVYVGGGVVAYRLSTKGLALETLRSPSS